MGKETVNYLNRDFANIKSDLIAWAKTYHSDKIVFFNDANPDIMYLEMVAYVGDMLSYYTDKTFNENFRTTSQAKESLVRIAHNLGFYNTGATSSKVQVRLSVRIPFTSNDGIVTPDYSYLPILKAGTRIKSDSGVNFEIQNAVNFTQEQDRIIIPNFDGNREVIDYTVTKKVVAKAGETKIQQFYVTELLHKPFLSFVLDDLNITEIVGLIVKPGRLSVAPPDYEFVDYNKAYYQTRDLAQTKAFFEINSGENSLVKQGAFQNIPRRFIVRRNADNLVSITFGNQMEEEVSETIYSPVTADEYINNVHDDVNLGVLPPINSTVFVKYRTGGGVASNVAANTINQVVAKQFEPTDIEDYTVLTKVRGSIKVTNDLPATGGRDIPTVEELRQISGKTFAAQDRGVTPEDIKAMVSLMPPQFGSPFRVSYEVTPPAVANMKDVEETVLDLTKQLSNASTRVEKDEVSRKIEDYFNNYKTNVQTNNILVSDPNLWLGEKGLLYVISQLENGQLSTIQKNENGLLVSPNEILKENIKNYLIDKRVIGDWIDIVDGKIYNIQVEFTIYADPNNQEQTLIDCLQALETYFDINNWQMGQSILLSNVQTILQEITGVISVASLKIYNIIGIGDKSIDPVSGRVYQPQEIGLHPDVISTSLNSYNSKFEIATIDNIIKGYSDSIFEVKYPESDIIGKVYS